MTTTVTFDDTHVDELRLLEAEAVHNTTGADIDQLVAQVVDLLDKIR